MNNNKMNSIFVAVNLLLGLSIPTWSYPNPKSGRFSVLGNQGHPFRYHHLPMFDRTLKISPSSISTSTLVDSDLETAKSQFSVMPIFGSYRNSKSNYSPRVQRLKDLSLQKEILKDVTAAEFALRIEVSSSSESQEAASKPYILTHQMIISALIMSTKIIINNSAAAAAAIDYGKLISKLQESIEIMNNRPELNNLTAEKDQEVNAGGIVTQSSIDLTTRIVHVKEDLELAAQGLPPKHMADNYLNEVSTVESAQGSSSTVVPTVSTGNRIKPLRILVREDG